ncbi:hypothetical protein CU633_19480 [Bacillus sp. V3-13]|uniref:hypothetical protein n=1 Tax=Bacillus sp. V3-13 TaxID=2053728 RepID=UPI000C7568FC|nr:hypothetical protein [Bacillus sp. V3-13]PLR75746.1 hypothetical protein CU633_19480 [Bacillus sp. V3-13]
MRKAYGIKNLIAYLASVNYPISEQEIHDLIQSKDIPHQRPINNMIVFNLNYIDWWVSQQRLKP